MTLLQFFKNINVDLLAKTYWDIYQEGEKEDIFASISEFLQCLFSLTPGNGSGVLMPVIYTADENRVVESVYYKKQDLQKIHSLPEIDVQTIPDIENQQEFEKYLIELRKNIPQTYGYEFNSWNDIIACDVFLGDASEEDVLAFASSVVYEMTFNGWTSEEQDKEREKLYKIIGEYETAIETGDTSKFVSASVDLKDLFTELEDELDMNEFNRKMFLESFSFVKSQIHTLNLFIRGGI